MDQGVAAVWAGIAGLAGAGIGGGFAAWGSWLGGRKAVEAAERAEQRAAAAEYERWQREKRYEAYQAYMAILEEVSRWRTPVLTRDMMDTSTRMREAASAVYILGPPSVRVAIGPPAQVIMDALVEFRDSSGHPQNEPIPPGAEAPWPIDRHRQWAAARSQFQEAVAAALGAPPA